MENRASNHRPHPLTHSPAPDLPVDEDDDGALDILTDDLFAVLLRSERSCLIFRAVSFALSWTWTVVVVVVVIVVVIAVVEVEVEVRMADVRGTTSVLEGNRCTWRWLRQQRSDDNRGNNNMPGSICDRCSMLGAHR
jgi:hypothetical protein